MEPPRKRIGPPIAVPPGVANFVPETQIEFLDAVGEK